MEFGAALSTATDTDAALTEAIAGALGPLSCAPDLVCLFASPHHLEAATHLASTIAGIVSPGGAAVGCVAEGVIGGEREVDHGPGLSVWAACLPDVDVVATHLEAVRSGHGIAITGAKRLDGTVGAIMFADPFTFPTGAFVSQLAEEGIKVVGGLPDAGSGPGSAALLIDGHVQDHGALIVWLAGAIEFRTYVSQGCRPLGDAAIVTEAQGTELHSIAGKPALDFVRDLFLGLDQPERDLARRGLHVGMVVDEYQSEFDRGDFLIRAVTAIDDDTGTISVGDRIAVGRTVQFQVRDPASADVDLDLALEGESAVGGVLLFSCNGRGERFFGAPDHDVAAVVRALRPPAVAGFFAAGEIGPVGTGNYLHGYTASLVELRPAGS